MTPELHHHGPLTCQFTACDPLSRPMGGVQREASRCSRSPGPTGHSEGAVLWTIATLCAAVASAVAVIF